MSLKDFLIKFIYTFQKSVLETVHSLLLQLPLISIMKKEYSSSLAIPNVNYPFVHQIQSIKTTMKTKDVIWLFHQWSSFFNSQRSFTCPLTQLNLFRGGEDQNWSTERRSTNVQLFHPFIQKTSWKNMNFYKACFFPWNFRHRQNNQDAE